MDIELTGDHTYGMTVCDRRHLLRNKDEYRRIGDRRGKPPYVEVGLSIDRNRFFDLLVDTLRQYP
ncbi:MAG: hypothetical protein FJY97_20380 [candidate division Zixibacteria bacterium]|nr:hypothetical protein [candidate division Zixibacteria bacterium]